jgi:ribosomal protein S18 acetylase RimI-like enzyme
LSDLNQLRKLEQVCFGGDAWPFLDLIGMLTLPGLVRLKAVHDGQMVGFVGGDPSPADGIGWIATIGVFPEFRRHGIATALLNVCAEEMRQPVIRLSVRKSNEAAAALYHREGFRLVDIWPRYYYDGEDGMVMEKKRLTDA